MQVSACAQGGKDAGRFHNMVFFRLPPASRVWRVTRGLDYGWTAFRNRSESETQPSAISALRSEASWLLRGNPWPIGSLMQSANNTHR